MKIDLKKGGGDFSSVNTFPPNSTMLLLDLSVLQYILSILGSYVLTGYVRYSTKVEFPRFQS